MRLSRKIQPAAAEEDKTSSTFEHNHIFHLYVTLWVLCHSLTETHAAAPCPTTWQRFIAWLIWSQRSFTSLWALSFGIRTQLCSRALLIYFKVAQWHMKASTVETFNKADNWGLCSDLMDGILILKKICLMDGKTLHFTPGLMKFKTMQQYHSKGRLNKIFPRHIHSGIQLEYYINIYNDCVFVFLSGFLGGRGA